MQRGQHDINDELIFTNHDGYIFHDSRGFEAGSKDELETVQTFVKWKSQRHRLQDRLHAIWFVVYLQLLIYDGHGCISGIAFRWTMIGHR